MIRVSNFLSNAEKDALDAEAKARGLCMNDRSIFPPGSAWYQPWYWDPTGERARKGQHVMCDGCSRIVCPDGDMWEIDRTSSNGDGWRVTINEGYITCSPSIVTRNYHGFLRDGVFTPDLDGRTYGG